MNALLLIAVLVLASPSLALAQDAASQPEAEAAAPPQLRGDREIVRSNGRLIATMPDGGGTRLSLQPGDYIVRFHGQTGQSVRLEPGATVVLETYGLTLVGSGGRCRARVQPQYEAQPYQAGPRYEEPYEPEPTYVAAPRRAPSDRFVLHFALGWSDAHSSIGFPGLDLGNNDFSATIALDVGITERLRWIAPLPLFAYRIGERARHKVELEPWLGVTNVGFGWNDYDGTVFTYALGAGIDGRLWVTRNQAWAFGVRAQTAGAISSYRNRPDEKPDTIRTVLTSAYQLKSRWINLSLGLGLAENVLYQNVGPRWSHNDPRFDLRLGLGSMQNFGPFPEPLISVNLTQRFSLDFYGSIEWSLATDGDAADSALFGFTWKI